MVLVTQNEKALTQKYQSALQTAAMDQDDDDDLAPFTFKDIAGIDLATGQVKKDRHFQIHKDTISPWEIEEAIQKDSQSKRRRSKR